MLYQESIAREAGLMLEKIKRDLKRQVEKFRDELNPPNVPMIDSDSSDSIDSDDSDVDYAAAS